MPGSSGSKAQRAASGMGMANVEEQPACWASGPGTSGLLGDPDRLLHTAATSQFPENPVRYEREACKCWG